MKKGFGTIVVIAGIVSLVISGIVFYQGVSKAFLQCRTKKLHTRKPRVISGTPFPYNVMKYHEFQFN